MEEMKSESEKKVVRYYKVPNNDDKSVNKKSFNRKENNKKVYVNSDLRQNKNSNQSSLKQNKQNLNIKNLRNQNTNLNIDRQRKPHGYNNLKITFLGGIDEIGKNMTLFEYGDDMIMVDAGHAFGDESIPGVEKVIQDLSYLEERKSKLRAIFITHGHEDHIGCIPNVLSIVKAPIYGTPITLGLVDKKLRDHQGKLNALLKPIKTGTVVYAGKFMLEAVSITHSIPGACAYIITTPAGVVVHTGDFKIDFNIPNNVCDMKRLAEAGKKGVDLLLCESTNVEREGFSLSETVVGKTIDSLLDKYSEERIIIATFASNVYRLQQIINSAVKHNRKVAFTGRSMLNVSDIAFKMGELYCQKEAIIEIDRISNYADKNLLIISTGSQGEGASALARIASDAFNKVKLGKNDVVILSSSPIPGNETQINDLINKLYRKDCNLIYNQIADVHASGHAYKEELKILHSVIKPKFFIPIHGEYRHLKNHQMLALELGMPERNVIIPELGMQVELNKDVLKVSKMVKAGDILIDGTGVGTPDCQVMRDRRALSESGLVIILVKMSLQTGKIIDKPDIVSRGSIYENEYDKIVPQAKETIFNTLKETDLRNYTDEEIQGMVRKIASSAISRKVKRKPMLNVMIAKF